MAFVEFHRHGRIVIRGTFAGHYLDTGDVTGRHADAVGLPGFQFIQDPVEYWSRTHHSNMDVFDRAQGEDLKQASVILAAFAWDAAMMDGKLPRKPLPP